MKKVSILEFLSDEELGKAYKLSRLMEEWQIGVIETLGEDLDDRFDFLAKKMQGGVIEEDLAEVRAILSALLIDAGACTIVLNKTEAVDANSPQGRERIIVLTIKYAYFCGQTRVMRALLPVLQQTLKG